VLIFMNKHVLDILFGVYRSYSMSIQCSDVLTLVFLVANAKLSNKYLVSQARVIMRCRYMIYKQIRAISVVIDAYWVR
jgi:hypothetical protein